MLIQCFFVNITHATSIEKRYRIYCTLQHSHAIKREKFQFESKGITLERFILYGNETHVIRRYCDKCSHANIFHTDIYFNSILFWHQCHLYIFVSSLGKSPQSNISHSCETENPRYAHSLSEEPKFNYILQILIV